MPKNPTDRQIFPLLLALLVFFAMATVLWLEIIILNRLTPSEHISTRLFWADILVGLTIYLKTSIDFAIFIGHLMRTNPGWRNRVAIECGTAIGNALGTLIVLALWTFFREIHWLLALMIILAAIVLLKMAEEGLGHIRNASHTRYPRQFFTTVELLKRSLGYFNRFTKPLLSRILPQANLDNKRASSWWQLLWIAGTIPFILGLDDFAGYVPLFSVVHVFGFAIGVLFGHLILNLSLFLSPKKTVALVTQPLISLIGSIAFVGLALWGLWEAVGIIFGL